MDVLGVEGQPMDVIFPISVAPIDKLGEISLQSIKSNFSIILMKFIGTSVLKKFIL